MHVYVYRHQRRDSKMVLPYKDLKHFITDTLILPLLYFFGICRTIISPRDAKGTKKEIKTYYKCM